MRRWAIRFGFLLWLALGQGPATAQLQGENFLVSSNTLVMQVGRPPAAVVDAAGNMVVIWEEDSGVLGRRFSPTGSPLGEQFQVNSYTPQWRTHPDVAMAGSGNFIVVWQSEFQDPSRRDIFGQLFDPAGAPIGNEFQINSYTTGHQENASVAAAVSGEFLVVWQGAYGQDGSSTGVFGQRFDAAGVKIGAEFQVNTFTAWAQVKPDIAASGSSGYIVVWEDYDRGAIGQRLDSAGIPAGAEFEVSADASYSVVASDSAGNFIVVWNGFSGSDDPRGGVFGQRFDSAGDLLGDEIHVNTYTTGYQFFPAVAANSTGEFVISWSSFPYVYHCPSYCRPFPAVAARRTGDSNSRDDDEVGQDGSGGGVYAQRFGSSGAPMGGEFRVNDFTLLDQGDSSVVAGTTGDFLVAWRGWGNDAYGVWGQRLDNSIFVQGFDSGDACAWSATVGGGCL